MSMKEKQTFDFGGVALFTVSVTTTILLSLFLRSSLEAQKLTDCLSIYLLTKTLSSLNTQTEVVDPTSLIL